MFSILIACGLGLPLPEDVALITGGFLAAIGPQKGGMGVGSVWLMMIVGLSGIVIGDSIIFKAGKDYGDALFDTRLGRHIGRARVDRIRELFTRHGSKLIMVARFLPGLRAPTFFVAGSAKVPFFVFALYDGIAALISAPVWVWLGFWVTRKHAVRRSAGKLEPAFAIAKQFQLVILCLMGLAMIVGLVWWLVARRRKAAEAQAAISEPPPANVVPLSSEKRAANGTHP